MLALRRKTRRIPTLLLMFALASVPLLLTTRAEGAAKTTKLAGILRNQLDPVGCTSPIGLCLKGNFYGSLTGPNTGVGFLFVPEADGVIFGKSHVVIHDRYGDVQCTSSSSFDTAADGNNNPFSDLCIITGGTGKWNGASGWIHAFGNGGSTGNAAEYRGEIRVP
ncbi:MAG: hypothetical protein QOI56_1886 [Actinomycetota bacterium]|nr:hypothetical protein [Actinomycetota bacterium]MEA2933101.1 hypothetical protein [Actinomycetota bacterium]